MKVDTKPYPIVGRYPEANLEKYKTLIKGRLIIDYEKIRQLDPVLYQTILDRERESRRRDELEDEALFVPTTRTHQFYKVIALKLRRFLRWSR